MADPEGLAAFKETRVIARSRRRRDRTPRRIGRQRSLNPRPQRRHPRRRQDQRSTILGPEPPCRIGRDRVQHDDRGVAGPQEGPRSIQKPALDRALINIEGRVAPADQNPVARRQSRRRRSQRPAPFNQGATGRRQIGVETVVEQIDHHARLARRSGIEGRIAGSGQGPQRRDQADQGGDQKPGRHSNLSSGRRPGGRPWPVPPPAASPIRRDSRSSTGRSGGTGRRSSDPRRAWSWAGPP
ncbi:hypothetical protein D3C72_1401330 [compost metagenome]